MRLSLVERFLRKIIPIFIKGINNQIEIKCKIKKGRIDVLGSNNYVSIPESCRFNNAQITISGENNRLIIEEDVRLFGPCKIILEGDATLILGRKAGVRGVNFFLKEGKTIVGELCMFSYGIKIRNHDSHKIFLNGDTIPCNPPADISIGRHVWICQDATILKGVSIGEDSIVGLGSVVTKSCPANSIVAGVPARIVRSGIHWDY